MATLLATKTLIAPFSRMVRSNLFALHFAFILHLTSRQHLLSCSSGPTGNLVKINAKEKAALWSDCEMIIIKCPGVVSTLPIGGSITFQQAVVDHISRSRCLRIIYNLYRLSIIIPVIWLKGFSPVSYLVEIQATWDTRDMYAKSFVFRSAIVWSFVPRYWVAKSNTARGGTKSTSLSATQWLAESSNLFGFVTFFFADFERLSLSC